MKKVNIDIPTRFGIRHYERQLPSVWNELSPKQLLFAVKFLNHKIKKPKFEILMLKEFLNIPERHFFKLNGTQLNQLSKVIKFLYEKTELTKQPFPVIKATYRLKRYNLFGADDMLANFSFKQFFYYSQPAFEAYAENMSASNLNKFIATLYTFEKDSFKENDVERITEICKKISTKHKILEVYFYMGCLDFIASNFPTLFKKEKKHDKDTNAKNAALWEAFVRLDNFIKEQKTKNNEPRIN